MMTSAELNQRLRKADLGDDRLEENLLFDTDFSSISRDDLILSVAYANKKMAWYWEDFEKHYLKNDCNRFHAMFLGHMLEWLARNREYESAYLGRAYGYFDGVPHVWGIALVDNEIAHINWGQIIDSPNYDGKGSVAI